MFRHSQLIVASFFLLSYAPLRAQTAPLESVKAEGSQLPQATILRLSGMEIGKPLDKPVIEQACKRLAGTGLFGSVSYKYGPGPKQGYAVTLELTDQPETIPAVIDIPGVNEDAVWQWLSTQYPTLGRKVAESSQDFIASEIQRHLASALNGEPVVARPEGDLTTGKILVIFQPRTLPQIGSISFNGVKEFRSEDLAARMQKAIGSEGFSERRFRMFLDGIVRQAYEEHGMYRVEFDRVSLTGTGGGAVGVITDIKEGPRFTFGQVQLIGDNLPVAAMLEAAAFPSGGVANWGDITQRIYKAEGRLKRTGYLQATSHPKRVLHDDTRVLDVNISYTLGPLYHFGQVSFAGLSSPLEAKARSIWRMQTGSPYDMAYIGDFVRDLSKAVDLRPYKIKSNDTVRSGYVVDQVVTFEPK